MPRGFVTFAFSVLLLGLLAPATQAWYPRTAQVELGTATWCSNCIYAYQGIEANKAIYDPNAFNSIRYYASTGGLGNPTADARILYYSSGFPEAIFDGTTRVLGGDTDFADGLYYKALIQTELCKPSYFKITINSFDNTAPSGSIDLDIEVAEYVPDLSNMYLRMILTEDDVTYLTETFQDVTRAQVGSDVAITVQLEGATQHVNQTFAIDAGWVGANLKVVAFIQDDDDQSVLASACTTPSPEYTYRYYALGERAVVGPITAHHHYEAFRLVNTGSEFDGFFFHVDTDGPAGWMGVLCEESSCVGPDYDIGLDPGQYIDLYVDLQAATSGYGTATVEIWQASRPSYQCEIKYGYLTDDLDVLIVDDDGARQNQTYFTSALDHYGYTYGVWDHDAFGAPSPAAMANFDAVIWSHGRVFPTLDAADRDSLAAYLDAGGRLFITGENLGYELEDIGGDAYTWYQTYLHADHFGNASDYTLTGVAGDVISGGIDITIQGGDGANNQLSPDDIDPTDAAATVIWTYAAGKNGALRIDAGTYRAVYFAFGFEAIDNASQRQGILHRILGWFRGLSDVTDEEPLARPALSLSPNPVLSSATLRFELPAPETVALRLFGPDGRLLRTFAEGRMDGGSHTIAWNRTDGAGAPLPAGVYYCSLVGERTNLNRKVIVVR